MPSPARRVLAIGLDGATFRLLDPLMAAGELPELAKLAAAGTSGELTSTFPALTPPAWASFMTGTNPGKHGVFAFRETAARSYASGDLVSARLLRTRTLWEIVNDAGLPVGVINVPPSYPVRPVDGFMVACMFTPAGEKRVAWPDDVRAVLGDDYVINVKPPPLRTHEPGYADRARGYLAQLNANAERRLAITRRLMAERPWSLLSVVFYEPDRVQHFFWDHLAGTGPADLEPALVAELRERALGVFRTLDRAVGELVRTAGDDAVTFVVSDHGFGPGPVRAAFVNRWLVERGWLRMHRGWQARRWLVKQLPRRLKNRYKTADRILVDFARSTAWCEVFETHSAGIWLNLRGRQPMGRIEPGSAYERLRDSLCVALRDVTDGGDRVFDMVARREEVYHGAALELAPDILLRSNVRHGFTFGLRTELQAHAAFRPFDGNGYTGAHEAPGIWMAAGPGVAAGGRRGPVPIEAMAPTFLALLGVPSPDGMDAPPLLDILTSTARDALTVRHSTDRPPTPLAEAGSEQDREEVAEQLRALGYME